MDWDKAKTHLREITKMYQLLPASSSWFGLGVMNGLEKRFDNGERTKELYQEMMDVE